MCSAKGFSKAGINFTIVRQEDEEQTLESFLAALEPTQSWRPLQAYLFSGVDDDLAALSSDGTLRDSITLPMRAYVQPPLGCRRALLVLGSASAPKSVSRVDGTAAWEFDSVDVLAVVTSARGMHATALAHCFSEADSRLRSVGGSFPDLVKMMTVMGDRADSNSGSVFEDLNSSRERFYRTLEWPTVGLNGFAPYPANTGVRDFSEESSVVGFGVRTSYPAVALENPRQRNPSSYEFTESRPLFSRSVVTRTDSDALALVSGAVSVVDRQVQHPGDPLRQCDVILENLTALLGPENLENHGIGVTTRGSALYAVVFVSKPSAMEQVEQRIKNTLGPDVPVLVVNAPLSMDDLCVEIETAVLYEVADGER